MSTSPPKPPAGLAARGKQLWSDVVDKFALDPAELEILTQLCRTTDELERLNSALAKAPVTVAGSRGQQVVNPLFDQALRHRRTTETLSRALCLPVEGEAVGSRTNPHRKAAATTRWRRTGIAKTRGA